MARRRRVSPPPAATTDRIGPDEIGQLLDDIEKEAVPERLLSLATQLQTALARRRQSEMQPVEETSEA